MEAKCAVKWWDSTFQRPRFQLAKRTAPSALWRKGLCGDGRGGRRSRKEKSKVIQQIKGKEIGALRIEALAVRVTDASSTLYRACHGLRRAAGGDDSSK